MNSRLGQFLLILSLVAMVCSCQETRPKKSLIIATASNSKEAIERIAKIFSKETNIDCEIVSSSSGKLCAQVMQGAPFDVFISADMKYLNTLDSLHLTEAPPQVFASGKLILWSQLSTIPLDIDSLTSDRTHRIAIANSKTAPYGFAAMQVMNHLNDTDEISEKLVFGESVSQVNQFIVTNSVDIGFTSLSTIKSPSLEKIGYWKEIRPELYSKLEHGIVLIKRGDELHKNSRSFRDFIFSEAAQNVLMNFGYSVNDKF